ncbi:SCO-spondin-like isoform X1 [Mercenaria mercenaria]|uniref:SCO-spondin-like isoform X1 n=1 Tax=Mercenaria mercenaria TaxID=6596 RepID=UPI00234EF92C|nr:SCO-spondin-like isoform X1 [Mercenaria mercenaria]
MIALSLSLPIFLQLYITGNTHAVQCYNCTDIADVSKCLTITECRASQSCYMEFKASGQTKTLGCTDNQQCGVTGDVAGSLVGRDLSGRQEPDCHECCSTDKCNRNLCEHLKPGTCTDDVKVDCAWMNSFFNICKDIHRAKLICPKFCVLCSLVDGNWASWSPWTPCDVTCENGTQTRTRTCTDPAPAHGGLDCIGSSTDTKPCLKQLCPVHGGWTKWSNWDACSVTCGVGIEKRHRNCSNPVPDRNGHQCFGDTLDARICLPGLCANGGWSDWGQWSTCSVTCGYGMQSRSRTCTNPRPSPQGKYCDGDPLENVLCRKDGCIPNIVFNAKGVTDISPTSGQTMIFGTTLVNEGHAYNTSTGIFTAPANGTYTFSTQFCVYSQEALYIAIVVDGVAYATMYAYDKDSDPCNTADTVAVLHAQSKVWVKCTWASAGAVVHEYSDRMNSFSGYLVHR